MSELWFKIGLSAILGCLSLTIVGFGIYMIASADDWMDRLSGVFVILLGILAGWFLIPCIWSVSIGGLQ